MASRSSTNYRGHPLVFYVGFVGDHGTGKSTFADNLEEVLRKHSQVNVLRVNMADSLRGMLGHAVPVEPDLSVKKHPLERPTLQFVGESWRVIDKNYWIQDFFDDVQRRIDALYGDDSDHTIPVVVLVADTYNLNELPLMDHVVMFRKPGAYSPTAMHNMLVGQEDRSDHKYVAETVRGTQWALHHPHELAQIVDGLVVLFEGATPAEIGRPEHLHWAANTILAQVNAKLSTAGLPVLFSTGDEIAFAGPSNQTDTIDSTLDTFGLTNRHWKPLEGTQVPS